MSLGCVCCHHYTARHAHSTGRGGYANITDVKSPDIEPPVHVVHPEHERISTGRGGVGNIRDRSQSKVRDGPEPHIRLVPHEHEGEIFYSSGRGGAGNIRSRSQSKPPKEDKVWFGFPSFFISRFSPRRCHTHSPFPPLCPPSRSHVTRVRVVAHALFQRPRL